MTAQEKIDKISTIDERLSTLEQQVNTAKAETKRTTDKRDKLNSEFRKIRQEINDLKSERDGLNEKVQTLKMLRDETRSKKHAIIEELRTTSEKIAELKKKTPKRSHSDLQKELSEIEWKIQTTSLDLNEEKRLIEGVKQLETQLGAYKKIEKQKKKTSELREKLEALKRQADTFHEELQVAAQKSQEAHLSMIAKIGESKKIKADADNLHSVYLEAKAKTEPANNEYKRLSAQRKTLQKLVEQEEEDTKKGKQQELKNKIASEARDKLKRGEKVSWDEFQLLNEDDSQAQG